MKMVKWEAYTNASGKHYRVFAIDKKKYGQLIFWEV